jgi:NAD(P)-dependent dehydrogenase (short-subunit alcohol dehydrogenase family)
MTSGPAAGTSRPVALVTGGGSGIGAATAAAFVERGSDVVIVGRRPDRLEEVRAALGSREVRVHPLAWDVADGSDAPALVQRAVEIAGAVDVLVHAAGNQIRKPALELSLEEFDSVVDLHLRAAFALSQAVGRHLVASAKPGSVIFVGSMTSQRAGLPNTSAYAAAKSGLLGLVRTLAVEWAPIPIRVNALLVGFVRTELTQDIDETPARIALTSRTPLGRHGTPDEIGRVIAFLASDTASYITGECLTVDGGWSVA